MPGDLFIKQRLPNGELSEPVPAFDGGETQAEKIASLKSENEGLLMAVAELYELLANPGGV